MFLKPLTAKADSEPVAFLGKRSYKKPENMVAFSMHYGTMREIASHVWQEDALTVSKEIEDMQKTAAAFCVAAVLAIAASAQADVWQYDFNDFSVSTSYADSWGFLSQVTTTEGWATGGSSTTTLQRGMVEVDPANASNKVITSNWAGGNYVNARISYAVGGGQGTLATITDMATAPKVVYTWDVKTGDYQSGSGRGFQWDVGVYEGTTQRLSLGNNSAANPGGDGVSSWLFYTPKLQYTATKKLVYNEWVVVSLEVDLDAGTGTVYFNGVADASLTNIDLVGTTGVDLRNAKNIWFDEHGGATRSLTVETITTPEPATMALLLVGGIGALLRRKRS
ncbi:MAG: PEP-CTERM sorting domain-containing protein [Planctomycetaceae bacterium]|nr:PEP-CTERM sorting domain-containing protein [Planctomycetaceae bacterium]